MTNKNPTLDIAKGIAIILVVYGHVIQHSMEPWSAQDFFLNPVFKIIYTFHMPLFVFISGYLMAYSLNRKSEQDVLKSRCKSLLVPCVFLGVLGTIMAYVLNIIFGNNTGRIDLAGDLANQLLKPSVWFLYTLFVLSALLIISVKLEKRFGAIIFTVIYLLLLSIPYNNYFDLYYIKWFYLFYFSGYFFNKYNIKIPDTAVQKLVFLFSLILFSLLLACWNTNDYIYINKMNFISNQYFYGIARVIYRYIMGFLGIIIIFYLAGYLLRTKIASLLGQIGVYSLDIYIIQMFLLEGIYPRFIHKAHIQLDLNSPWVLFLVAPLITVFFVSVCILSSRSLIRKNPLLDKLILGGRK
jgi:fucose 4-O-acetylase-like acetyltransferase